jgi:hypothetical protein
VIIYRLPAHQPAFGHYGIDEHGAAYFHAGLLGMDAVRSAHKARVFQLVRLEFGFAPLVSFEWARANFPDRKADLDSWEANLRQAIASGLKGAEEQCETLPPKDEEARNGSGGGNGTTDKG